MKLSPTWLARLWVALAYITIAAPAQADAEQFADRVKFREAREQLRAGQTSAFRQTKAELSDYILTPYLEYYYINDRISSVSERRVLDFLAEYGHLPASALLKRRWLKALGARRQWQTLLEHYEPTSDAALQCYRLRALYNAGKRDEALAGTAAIWTQPTSQPKACDPLFDVWQSSDYFTVDVAWTRLTSALQANQRGLASYLTRFFTGANRAAADAFYRVHVSPARIARNHEYRTDSEKMRTVITHGIGRLADRDAPLAASAWQKYSSSHSFSPATAQYTTELVLVELAEEEGRFPVADSRVAVTSPDTIEALTNAAVEHMDWEEIVYWVGRAPPELAAKSQWQYWLARAVATGVAGDGRSADQIYAGISRERHYYGFMAANRLGLPGAMNAVPPASNDAELNRVRRQSNIARAIELYAVGDDINARREWFAALKVLDQAAQLAAARLAFDLGLTTMAIRTANIAEARDHLHLRFPVAYEPQFRQASLKTDLPAPLLMAIARQESALEATARSSADARGLMQLLPSTARLVARRARSPSPSTRDLYDPSTNIALGSYHLAWLLARYDNQSPLAMAAYNAGEHRVDRWIKDADELPMDIWIERIPFRETRNYVKNVIAFRHVYGFRLGEQAPLLGVAERAVRAP